MAGRAAPTARAVGFVVLVMALAILARALFTGDEARGRQPVFAPVFTELFAAGGALTDAWADFDGDGDPDRFVGFNGSPSRLYRNDLAEGFRDVAAQMGLEVERAVRTSAWGDFDADGDPDLFLGYAGDAPVTALWRNEGGEGFREVSGEVGLSLADGATRQASWVDFDGDGDLDLFLALRNAANRLYRNDGGTFSDVAAALGVDDPRRTVGAVWFDADRNGLLDVIVANMDGDANGLWLQGADGFVDAAAGTDLAAGGRALGNADQGTVRPCVADYDGDGFFDVFTANYGPNGLLRGTVRDGRAVFRELARDLGLAIDGRYDTCALADFDHDGDLDVYVNGTITGGRSYRDYLFRQDDGRFYDVTPEVLLAAESDHGATWLDYDMDGDLDLSLVGAGETGMHLVFQNLLRPEFVGHSLQIRVLDAAGRAARPGAEVRVYAAGTDQLIATRLVDSGSGYDAQSDLPVHFGLPSAQPVDVVVTTVVTGVRRETRVEGVDPLAERGRVLSLRIDDAGNLVG